MEGGWRERVLAGSGVIRCWEVRELRRCRPAPDIVPRPPPGRLGAGCYNNSDIPRPDKSGR